MPRSKNRMTDKAKWTEETMSNALGAIQEGKKIREVSRSFKIPLATLHGRMKIAQHVIEQTVSFVVFVYTERNGQINLLSVF